MRKIIQAKFVVLIALLSACSSPQIFYTLVDDFIEDEISYFLDLDEEQKFLLSRQVGDMVTWHRTSMMPSYAIYLENIADNLEMEQYNSIYVNEAIVEGKILIEETISGLIPYASKFLTQYQTEKAIKFMEKKMFERQQKRLKELMESEDELYEKRLDRLTSNFQRFFGDLTDAQVILIENYARDTLNNSKIRLENRTMRQKVFLDFLRTQPNENQLFKYLNKLILRGHLIINPSYRTFSEANLKRFHFLLETMLAISSSVQREKIIVKIRNYADEFKAVSG